MGLVTDPNTLANCTVSDADDVQAKFNTLFNLVNGSIDNANISASAAIAESKLALDFKTSVLSAKIGGSRQLYLLRPIFNAGTFEINLPTVTSFMAPSATPGQLSTLIAPYGLDYDGDRGVLWMSDNLNDEIYQINTATSAILSSFDVTGLGVRGLAYDGSNALWVVGNTTDRIYRYNTLGTVLSSFAAPGSNPTGITYLGSSIYLADDVTDLIYRLNTLGTQGASWTPPGAAAFNITGVTDNGLDLFLADDANDLVYKTNTLGTLLSSFYSPGRIDTSYIGSALNTLHSITNVRDMGFGDGFLWSLNDDRRKKYLLKNAIMDWRRVPPHFVYWSGMGGEFSGTPSKILNITRDFVYPAIGQGVSALHSLDVAESADNGVAADDDGNIFYMTTSRVLRFNEFNTLLSSFSLGAPITTLKDITWGDSNLYVLSTTAGPDNIVYVVPEATYIVDSLQRAVATSFNIDAAGGVSDTVVGIGYDDEDPKRHSLWVTETTGPSAVNISSSNGAVLSSFAIGAGVSPAQSIERVGEYLYILEGAGGTDMYIYNTLGTVISSHDLPGTASDYQGLSWGGRKRGIILSGDDVNPGTDDLLWMIVSHVIVHVGDTD